MVAGVGGGHVQQPQLLMAIHLGLEIGVWLVELGGERLGQAQLGLAVLAPQHADPPPGPPGRRGHTTQYGDGELEALGAVHGHDAHRCSLVGQHRLVYGGPVRTLEGGPVEERPQPAPAGVLEGARRSAEEAQPTPDVGRSLRPEGEQEAVPLRQHLLDQLRGASPPTLLPQGAQVTQRLRHRLGVARRARRLGPQVPAPCRW